MSRRHQYWRYNDYYAERLIWFMEKEYQYHNNFGDIVNEKEWGIGDEFCLEWQRVQEYKKVIRRLVRQEEYTAEQYHKLCKQVDKERKLHKFIEKSDQESDLMKQLNEQDARSQQEAHDTILKFLKDNEVHYTLFYGGKYGNYTIRVPYGTQDIGSMIEHSDISLYCSKDDVVTKAHKFTRKRCGGKLFNYYTLWV